MDKTRPDSDLSSEACAWIAQLETGELTPQDLAAFREWVGRSPRHAEEIRRMARLAAEVNSIAAMDGPLSDAIESYRPLLAAKRRRWQWLTVAAALLLTIGAIFIGAQMRQAAQPTLLTTAVGDYRTETLADGTEVKLNSNSQLEVSYTRELRRVRLLKGEAYFSVAHDESVPFVVFAQEKYVRAVGTAFAVRMTNEDLAVLVTNGVVELHEADEPASQATGSALPVSPAAEATATVRLRAGQGVTVSLEENLSPAAADVVAHSEREMQRTLAWREGLLDFSRTPLRDVVAEVSRHTLLHIEIADPALLDLKFDGMFRVGQIDQLLDALGENFDIRVERIDAGHVRLSSKDQKIK